MVDLNAVLNIVTLIAAATVAVPVLRAKRKDAIITEQSQVIESHERRIKALEDDLLGAQKRADELAQQLVTSQTDLAAANARYEEQAKYTAGPAIEQFKEILLEHQQAVQERHQLMIAALERITGALDVPRQA